MRPLRIQSLDHHLLLASVLNHEVAVGKHNSHGIHNFVEAARRTALLCKANDAERLFPTMLNYRHYLCSKSNFLEIQTCDFC